MADESSRSELTPEFVTPTPDIFQVKVNSSRIYEAIDKTGEKPLNLSNKVLDYTVFESETSELFFYPEGQGELSENHFMVVSIIKHSKDRLGMSDKGFYDDIEIETIRELMEKRGLETSIISRKNRIRNLIVEKDGVCVAIDLGAEPAPNDYLYKDPDIEAIPAYIPPEERQNNDQVMLFTIDKNSIAQKEIVGSVMPDKEEFVRQMGVYGQIYQVFLNVMMVEEGQQGTPRVVELG